MPIWSRRREGDAALPRRSRVSGRGRLVLLLVAGLAIGLLLSARAIAGAYTDYLWFDSLDVAEIWQRRLGYQVVLALLFSLAAFATMAVNLLVANRFAPAVVPRRTGDELVERYREVIGPRQRTVWLAVSLGFAVLAGSAAASQWQAWALFRFGGTFGDTDPQNGADLGFYVFQLPFIDYLLGWAFATLLIVALFVTMAHYLTGAIHLPGTGAPASTRVKAHLSTLFALLALVKAADYWVDRYRLTLSTRGTVTGALYTDVNAALPAATLLFLVAVLCAGTFVVNVRRRGWGLPLITVGLWVVVALVAGVVYPVALQRLKVDAEESALESKYIGRNIAATRSALGLDRVAEQDFDYQDRLSDQAITDNEGTVSNVRLLDPEVVRPTFTTLQATRDFYEFTDLDVDRYLVNDQPTEVIIGARELDPSSIPRPTWESRHLAYTHGYGVALAPANAVNADGDPDFAVGDKPVRIDRDQLRDLKLDRPEIYFGEGLSSEGPASYAIVGTRRAEDGDAPYRGTGGVPIDTFWRKLAFGLRFGDLEPLTSDYLTGRSRVLYLRGIHERVSEIAPFLSWDHDPYPVLLDGHIQYVVDGYTTSASYPYGQEAEVSDLEPGADLTGQRFNYLRNSVKAVVDAYDGTVTMYMTDEMYGQPDPIIRAYARAFPELLRPASAMPEGLRSHLRYPEDMFRVQTAMWGRYHIGDPGDFYRQDDGWDVAQRPPKNLIGGDAAPSTTAGPNDAATLGGTADEAQTERIKPYYLQMRLPSERSDEFVLFRPFVPHSRAGSSTPRKQLTAFMVGRSDPEDYGQLVVYTMTTTDSRGGRQLSGGVDGPLTAHENMQSDPTLSQRLTLLDGEGSTVEYGNLVLVPIERGLLYVRPVYVASDASGSARRLRMVVVATGGQVAFGPTLAEALKQLFPTATVATREQGAPADTNDDPGDDNEASLAADELIASAVRLFDEADAILRSGGAERLADYQAKIAEAQELVRRAQAQLEERVTPVGG